MAEGDEKIPETVTSEPPRFVERSGTGSSAISPKTVKKKVQASHIGSTPSGKSAATPKPKTWITRVTVTNTAGGHIYLRLPKSGEVRLGNGESITRPMNDMPMGLIERKVAERKMRMTTSLVEGD